MLGLLRRLSGTFRPTHNITEETTSTDPIPPPSISTMARLIRDPYPYESPAPNGICYLLQLPETALENIFTRLDRVSLTRSYRLCKTLNEGLNSNSVIALHHLLLCNSLNLNPNSLKPTSNPHQIPPSSAELLSTLRERLTRFRNFTPKSKTSFEFQEPEGRLYEYLEGVLLRGIGGRREHPRELAVYDLRKLEDWEEVGQEQSQDGVQRDGDVGDGGNEVEGGGSEEEVTEEEVGKGIREIKKFDFEMADFAVDPGQDLLIIAEVRATPRRSFKMFFHLLALSTFEPHPLARDKIIEWPGTIPRRQVQLGFQICDDGFFVLNHNIPGGAHDQLCGWQWTSGRLGVTMRAFPTMTFESFVLLSPSAFVVPTIITHLDPFSETAEDLNNPDDLTWTHHLHLYAFPPFSSIPVSSDPTEAFPPPHTAIHIATIDLPLFYVNINANIPPPRLTIRTDPPPRHGMPNHPIHAPAQFQPTPETGLIVMEVFCQLPQEADPHYVICMLKSTLIQYLPAPTSPLLFQAFPRPAPVVQWDTIAPQVRMFGPDLTPHGWVCYVNQNRYVVPHNAGEYNCLRLYDFDPLRVRKEQCDRKYSTDPLSPSPPKKRTRSSDSQSSSAPIEPEPVSLEGERDGITLITEETIIQPNRLLTSVIKTGGRLPYMYVEKTCDVDEVLLDGERIVTVENVADNWGDHASAQLEVMEF